MQNLYQTLFRNITRLSPTHFFLVFVNLKFGIWIQYVFDATNNKKQSYIIFTNRLSHWPKSDFRKIVEKSSTNKTRLQQKYFFALHIKKKKNNFTIWTKMNADIKLKLCKRIPIEKKSTRFSLTNNIYISIQTSHVLFCTIFYYITHKAMIISRLKCITFSYAIEFIRFSSS